MALVPGRQLCLESSFSKFHGTSLRLFRYSCSVPLKPHALYSYSPFDKNPPSKSISQMSPKKMDLSTSDWLSEWNKPSKPNRLKPPQAVFNYRSNQNMNGANGSTMERILEKLKKHGYIDGDGDDKKEKEQERVIEKGSVEDIFYVEEGMLPNARGGFSKDSPLGIEDVFKSDGEVRFPWEKPKKGEEEGEEEGRWTARSKSRTNLAELTLPPSELRRLRQLTYQAKSRVKIKSRGVTQEVVDAIHEKWKTDEIVRLKVDGAPALNMKRVHEILERKTGGLVIWRNGTSISLYRGMSYEVPSMQLNKRMFKRNEVSTRSAPIEKRCPSAQDSIPVETGKIIKGPSLGEEHAHQSKSHTAAEDKEKKESKMSLERIYEDKIDNLLEGLGPRYLDWPECDPLPVDADMLPGIVPGYQPPFRILPYGVRSTLGCKEATSVRRLARVLPPHFALGRSRHLQGLAVAIIKLWEKSSIAKIALKRGVQLTTSERMAEDIKKLTGGLLVSRNKDFLVFYRGKNFLSPDVSEALLEKERLAKSLQDEEERARSKSLALVTPNVEIMEEAGTAGTLEETLDANARWGKLLDDSHKESIMREAELERRANLVRKLENKLAFSERRLMKAKQALSKVEAFLQPSPRQADPESISDEERFMFRKLGLKMQAFALLGRRGVFDGTVENMHLHWKYRELVKIILKAKNFEQVKKIALALEAESGGILVSVDKVSKGYAIIVYRGKDYQRPSTLRPKNLLTKRKALARSKEIQRHEALLSHVSALQNKVEKLRSEIHQMAALKDQGNNKLYERLDSSYPTDDDDETEKEGNEAYLEAYNSENGVDYDDADFGDNDDDVNDKTEKRVQDVQLRFDFPSSFQDQESETELEDENEAYVERYDGDNDGVLPMPNGDLLQKVHANLPPNARNHVSTNPSP